jgi:hypothetical protein
MTSEHQWHDATANETEIKEYGVMKMNNETIICNAIMTPDGTYLRSYHRHDYKEHLDKVSGEIYIVDGGNDYLRRSFNTTPATFMDVYLSHPFETIRRNFAWKSYGKNGEHIPHGVYIFLYAMDTDHIRAILATQEQINGTYVEMLFKKELVYRTGTVTLGENNAR